MAANLVKLISSDNKKFEVEVAVAMESETVKEIIETKGINKPIPLQVLGDILAKVVEYCKYHVESQKNRPATPEDEIKAWDADFIKVDTPESLLMHIALHQAARYLKIKNLLKLTTLTTEQFDKIR